MSVRLTSDGKALVDTRLKYLPIDPKDPPKGKVLLIHAMYRQPVVGEYQAAHKWTHYFPLPTFSDTDDDLPAQGIEADRSQSGSPLRGESQAGR